VPPGYDPEKRKYDDKKWRYDSEPAKKADAPADNQPKESFSDTVGKLVGPPPKQDLTLRHERCVWQILKKHFHRYTPQMVEDVCGTPRDAFLKVADALLTNAGPDRTGAMCYALGWTQHTVGVQMIRCAAMIQLLLGNIGRPGGGIMALRGHATIQGSTDIATLFNLLPGYLNAPSALRPHATLLDYIKAETSATSWWSNFPKYIVSQLKSWYGDAATADNDFVFDFLPKSVGDHSHIPMFVAMNEGVIKGFMAVGQNPAGSGQNSIFHRQALGKLDWLVVRDLFETETATFWKNSPEVASGQVKPEDIQTEVIFLPAAAVAETDGSFTNTQRLLQWHDKAADPPDDARSDVWFTYHLGRRLKELYADSTAKKDRPIQAMTWDYLDENANAEWRIKDGPSSERILKEVSGFYTSGESKGKQVGSFVDLKNAARPPAVPGFTPACSGRPRNTPKGPTGPPIAIRTTGCRSTGAGLGRSIGESCTTAARRTRRAAPGPRRPASPLISPGPVERRRAVTCTGTPRPRSGSASTCRTSRRPRRPTRPPRPAASASKRTTARPPS
jgi:formate dehydrogenase major subunit